MQKEENKEYKFVFNIFTASSCLQGEKSSFESFQGTQDEFNEYIKAETAMTTENGCNLSYRVVIREKYEI